MTLPNANPTLLPRAPATGVPFGDQFSAAVNTPLTQLTANDMSMDARIAILETKLNVNPGLYTAQPPNQTLSAKSSLYANANKTTEVVSASGKCVQSYGGVLDVFLLPGFTINNLPVVITVFSGGGNAYQQIYAWSVPASGAPTLLGSYTAINAVSTAYDSHEILSGSGTFRTISGAAANASYNDWSVSSTGAITRTNNGTIGAESPSSTMYPIGVSGVTQASSCKKLYGFATGSQTILYGYVNNLDNLPYLRSQARAVAGSSVSCTYQRFNGCYQSNTTFMDIDSLGNGNFAGVGLSYRVGTGASYSFFGIYADDTHTVVRYDLNFGTTGVTDTSIWANSPALCFASVLTSSGRLMYPVLYNADAAGIMQPSFGIPSPYYASGGGFALTLSIVFPWSNGGNGAGAVSTSYMLTTESAANTYALRGISYTAQNGSTAATLAEVGSPLTFTLGTSIDTTTGGMQTPKACRVGADQYFVASCSSANGSVSGAYTVAVLNPS